MCAFGDRPQQLNAERRMRERGWMDESMDECLAGTRPSKVGHADLHGAIQAGISNHDAGMKALKSSVLAACYLIVVVGPVSAEENRLASPTSGRTTISTTPNQGVREAATRAVRLIDRTSAS